jgi:hypothetical protein
MTCPDMGGYSRTLFSSSILQTHVQLRQYFRFLDLRDSVSRELGNQKLKKNPPAVRMMAATNFAARYATGPILELPSGWGRGRSVPSHRRHRASLSSTRHKLARWRHGTLSMRISSECKTLGDGVYAHWCLGYTHECSLRHAEWRFFCCFCRFNAMYVSMYKSRFLAK